MVMKHCDWFLKFLNIAIKHDSIYGIYVDNMNKISQALFEILINYS